MPAALAIFVKTPGLSPIKTRLARGIGAESAIHFHKLAARATAEVVSACGDRLRPYWALAEDNPLAYESWTEFPCIVQGSGNLGDRLYRVHAQLQTLHGSSVIIGTDIPQITPSLILAAVGTLRQPHTAHVLGPANDGGFWLFGSKREVSSDTWNSVPYSTPDTVKVLKQKLADTGPLETLPTLTDIDTVSNLADLREALSRVAAPTQAQRELLTWVTLLLSGKQT